MTSQRLTKLGFAITGAVALGLGMGAARADDGHGHSGGGPGQAAARPPASGEVRVYLLDQEKKPVAIEGMSATLHLEIAGGLKKTVKLTLAEGELGHGQTLPMGDRFVRLEVKKPHAGHGQPGHGEGHGDEHEGHGEDHGGDHGGGGHDGHADPSGHGGHGAAAFFRGEIPLEAYACPMGCVLTDKAGKCPKCRMEMSLRELAFSAVVVVKGKDGRSQNVKGFQYPAGAAPETLTEAIARVEAIAAAVEARIAAGKLGEVHEAAEPLKVVGDALPGLAGAGAAKDKAEALGAKLKQHFDELDEAGDAGNAAKTQAALGRLRETLAELKQLGE